MKKFDIPGDILSILRIIENAGYEAWLVGGCVRDLLLCRAPKDYDIATSAFPADIARIFEKTADTGIKYGTVTAFYGKSKAEITTYRSESGYHDNRRPDQVFFGVGLFEDLSRRDFTINAIAYHPGRGLYDPFLGVYDIDRRRIKAVRNPAERFEEDALRILRAFRFSAQLGFDIENATYNAAVNSIPLLARISVERIREELHKILMSQRPAVVYDLIKNGLFEVLGCCVTDSQNFYILNKTQRDVAVRWTALTFLISSAEIMQRLKFDHATKKDVCLLLDELTQPMPSGRAEIKRRLSIMNPDLYRKALQLESVLLGWETTPILNELDDILKKKEPYRLNMLAVNGKDILNAGITGRECGRVLKKILNYVIIHPQANTKDQLLKIVSDRIQ